MTKQQAECILKTRDALAQHDVDEAYHWLYQIASPNFDKDSLDVWADIEKIANQPQQGNEGWVHKFANEQQFLEFMRWRMGNELPREGASPIPEWISALKKIEEITLDCHTEVEVALIRKIVKELISEQSK